MKSIWTLLILCTLSFSGVAQGKQIIGLIQQIPLDQYVHQSLFLPKTTSNHPEVNAESLLKQFDISFLILNSSSFNVSKITLKALYLFSFIQ